MIALIVPLLGTFALYPVPNTWNIVRTINPSFRTHEVAVSVPSSEPVGQLITVTATPLHFLHPVYQFWVDYPGGSYESSGPYQSNPQFSFPASTAGNFTVQVYARESNAPDNENATQRAEFEVTSSSATVNSVVPSSLQVLLTASQPIVRSGQPITLTAVSNEPLPAGCALQIVDTSTRKILNQTMITNHVSATTIQQGSQVFHAQIITAGGQIITQSNPMPMTWSTAPIGTYGGHDNALGQSVSLKYPNTAMVNQSVTISAIPYFFQSPVYQYWLLPPNGSYISSGSFSANSSYTFTPNQPGSWQVMVYARESTAPSNETPTQQAIYEAKSQTYDVNVEE